MDQLWSEHPDTDNEITFDGYCSMIGCTVSADGFMAFLSNNGRSPRTIRQYDAAYEDFRSSSAELSIQDRLLADIAAYARQRVELAVVVDKLNAVDSIVETDGEVVGAERRKTLICAVTARLAALSDAIAALERAYETAITKGGNNGSG